MYRKTYLEVNLDNLASNINNILTIYPDYKYYFGVVKGNGYGHSEYIVNTLIDNGINYIAVSSLEEAINVRKYNQDIPVLCLEPIDLEFIDEVIKYNITLTIHDLEYFMNLNVMELDGLVKVHLKIDSGMHRLGLTKKEDVLNILKLAEKNICLKVEGIYTHMATLGRSDKYWDIQINNFKEITSLIDLNDIEIIHISGSCSLENHPKIEFTNGVRLGIMMYGFSSIPKLGNSFKSRLKTIKANMRIKKYKISKTYNNSPLELKTCMRLYSSVIQIKKLQKGDFVGYGANYIANEEILVATIPIGYADGINKKITGNNVIIKNKKYPIIGTISMGMLSVKVDKNIEVGDKVTIIDYNNIKQIAASIGTNVYELMTNINPLIPRVYIKNSEVINIEEKH